MSTEAKAIYEDGVLRLLTPVALPERTEVRIQILADTVRPEQKANDELERAEAVLIAAGLVKPKKVPEGINPSLHT